MRTLDGALVGVTMRGGLIKIPTKVGDISWITYCSLIMFEVRRLWYEATTWKVITDRLMQIFVRFEHKEIWGTAARMEYSQKGWNTKTEEAKLNLMKGVAHGPLLDGQSGER